MNYRARNRPEKFRGFRERTPGNVTGLKFKSRTCTQSRPRSLIEVANDDDDDDDDDDSMMTRRRKQRRMGYYLLEISRMSHLVKAREGKIIIISIKKM